jgi:hypothetical protein
VTSLFELRESMCETRGGHQRNFSDERGSQCAGSAVAPKSGQYVKLAEGEPVGFCDDLNLGHRSLSHGVKPKHVAHGYEVNVWPLFLPTQHCLIYVFADFHGFIIGRYFDIE